MGNRFSIVRSLTWPSLKGCSQYSMSSNSFENADISGREYKQRDRTAVIHMIKARHTKVRLHTTPLQIIPLASEPDYRNTHKVLMTITIDCPVCNSRNTFVTGTTEKLSCDDCGFLLADDSQVPSDKCLICGSKSFYYSSPFGLAFPGRDAVCYICGAHYRKARIDHPEPRFSEESFERAQQSHEARQFKERASHWH